MVRARVIHYHELVAKPPSSPVAAAAAAASPRTSETPLFRDGDEDGGGLVLTCVTGTSLAAMLAGWMPPDAVDQTIPVAVEPRPSADALYILEGSFVISAGGRLSSPPPLAIEAGDTLVLPAGWTGTCEVREPVKALRVRAAAAGTGGDDEDDDSPP